MANEIYRQTFAWVASGKLGERYIRAQPLFRSTVMAGRNATLLGWKLWLSDRPPLASFGVRLDIGGGQVDDEGDATRLLVAATLPLTAADEYTPRTLFASNRPGEMFGSEFAVFAGWPGCYGCVPAFCDDTVRLLVAPIDPDPPGEWRFRVNATLWLRDDPEPEPDDDSK